MLLITVKEGMNYARGQVDAVARGSEIERMLEIWQRCSLLEFFGYTFLGAMPKRCSGHFLSAASR